MASRKDESVSKPERILICAPSNAAIDEIVRIILDRGESSQSCRFNCQFLGLFDEDGNKTTPFLVRLGPNYHPSIKQVSIEYLLSSELSARALRSEESERLRVEVRPFKMENNTILIRSSIELKLSAAPSPLQALH
jgi:senataxin